MNAELHIVFKVAGEEYVIPAEQVLQMESYTGATRVPGSPPYVAGIVQIRGKVIPVVDLRLRFGLPAIESTLDSRVVVGRDGDRAVGLLVDSAREVLKLLQSEMSEPPSMVTDQAQGFVKAVARPGKRLLMVIDFQKVIGEESLHGN
ncbi:MAG: chemotaxis protein CheW [Myxococcaceae bacterium]